MSLNLSMNKARLTVFGYGWDDAVVDSGDANTDEGAALEEYVENNTDYEFPDDFDWDAVAEDFGVELDDEGNISEETYETLDENLYDLANDPDAIIDYMTEKNASIIPPARIVILNPPDRTTYTDGESIDLTGIIVAVFTSLTTMTPFINSALEGEVNNLVPLADLTCDPTVAAMNGEQEYDPTIGISVSELSSAGGSLGAVRNSVYTKYNDDVAYGAFAVNYYSSSYSSAGWCGPILISRTYDGASYYDTRTYSGGNTSTDLIRPSGILVDGEVWYVNDGSHWSASAYESSLPATNFGGSRIEFTDIIQGMHTSASTEITVKWQTEYQEDPFTDTFDITVTEAE